MIEEVVCWRCRQITCFTVAQRRIDAITTQSHRKPHALTTRLHRVYIAITSHGVRISSVLWIVLEAAVKLTIIIYVTWYSALLSVGVLELSLPPTRQADVPSTTVTRGAGAKCTGSLVLLRRREG